MPEETADAVRQAALQVADALAALETEKDRREARRWLRDAVSRLRGVFAEADPPQAEHEVGLQNLIAQLSVLELAVTRAHGRPASGLSVTAATNARPTPVPRVRPGTAAEAGPGTRPAIAPHTGSTPGAPPAGVPSVDVTAVPIDVTAPAPPPVEAPSPARGPASLVVVAPQRPKVPPSVPGPGVGAATTAAVVAAAAADKERRPAAGRSEEDPRLVELRAAVETWWPTKSARSEEGVGFRPEIQELGHEDKVAKERIAGAGTLEGLARGLRLDALRVPAGATRSPLEDLDRVLGSRAPGESLLPGWGEALPAVGARNSPHAELEDLPSLWRELERVAADGQDTVPDGSAPHTVSSAETEALCRLARRALDLAAVVRESTLVGCSGLAFIDAPGADRGVHLLAARTELWKRRFYSCVRTLRLHSSNRAEGSERKAYLTALIQFDEVLAQIVPDPVPHPDSWWQRQRGESAAQLRTLLRAQGADHRGGFVKYEVKENFKGLVQDEIPVRKRGDTAEVLWWLRLPYVVNEGDATALCGRAILTPRDKR